VNVTAAIWRGAASRGAEVPDTASSFDPDAFTREHAAAAIRAGVASVLSDPTGIVIWLD
jgi:glycine/D-amino acid oxidase-like deaminating enzyme